MIKKLFICALPVLAMTACTSEEEVRVPVDNNQEIAFNAVNQVMSRNDLLNNGAQADFPKSNFMYVTALIQNGSNHAVYFQDQAFKYESTDEVWKGWDGSAYEHFYYPYSGTLQFMAYSTSGTHIPAVWTYDNATTPTAFDKLVLDFGSNLEGTEDVMYSNKVISQDAATASGAKSFEFNHALALLTFEVKYASTINTKNIKITVKDISVDNVEYSGKLTVTNNGASGCTANWEAPDGSLGASKNVPHSDDVEVAADPKAFGTGLLVINQTLPINAQFTVTYDMEVGGNTYEDLTKTVTFAQGSIATWNVGTKYLYTLILSPEEITFTGEVKKWGNGGSENETISNN